ncbi:MAG TPA: hypothetical protein VF323_02785 [Candidatus Limnocylindrales bacterium]
MHVRRDLLFSGLFLIPVGAITLLVLAGAIDAHTLLDAWRLWPLILVGFGIVLLLGRHRAASLGTAVTALVIGVIAGSALASGTIWIGDITECGSGGVAGQHVDRTGTFAGSASVDLRVRCGSVALSTRSGTDWSVAADYRGPAPIIVDATDRLEVRVPDGGGIRHHDWTIAAPAARLGSVQLEANAATGSLTFDGATLAAVKVEANAGDILVDGGSATIGRIDLSMNAGRARITLGAPTVGTLSVNAGAIDLCVPASASLRFVVQDQLTFVTNLADHGLTKNGTTWTRTGSAGGPPIELRIEGNAAGFTLDPSGGCR